MASLLSRNAAPRFSPEIDLLKKRLRKALTEVSSSHLTEAVASALGYASHAALLASFSAVGAVFDERLFYERLGELGYPSLQKSNLSQLVQSAGLQAKWNDQPLAVDGKTAKIQGVWRIVVQCPYCGRAHNHGGNDGRIPDGGHRVADCISRAGNISKGYFLTRLEVVDAGALEKFKQRVNKMEYRTTKQRAWRNLMVSAVNAALQQGVFTLHPDNYAWKLGDNASDLFEFEVAGYRAQGHVWDGGFGEIVVHAIIGLKAPGLARTGLLTLRSCEAFGDTWVERRNGAWLQPNPSGFRCKDRIAYDLSKIDVSPTGFADRGPVML